MSVPRTHRPSGALAAVFAVVFASLAGMTVAAWSWVPWLGERLPSIALAEPPDDGESYLAADRGGHVDHHVHYFGLDDRALAALRAADVLFLGNSRLMFALRPDVLDPYFRARNLSYYVMGFGFREGDRFPLEILRRFDITPRLVVVNADGFFGRDMSDWAAEVVADSQFDAVKLQHENAMTHVVRRIVHRVLPNWLDVVGRPGLGDGQEFITYRSRENGTWDISPWPTDQAPVPLTPLDAVAAPRTLDAARRFQDELDERGSALVLTFVPTPAPETLEAASVAETLQVPLVMPRIEGLTSHDESHLTEDSAALWTEQFVQALSPHLPVDR